MTSPQSAVGETIPDARAGKLRRRIFFVLTNVISLIFLVWTLHGVNFRQLRSEVAHLDWGWVILASVFDIAIYVLQACRWAMVLRPVDSVSVWNCARAIFVGLFANEVLPLRAGEIVRCYLLSGWTEIPVSVTLASALIERIFDGIWLVVCLFLTVRFVHLPMRFVVGGMFLALLLLVCAVLIGIGMFWREQTLDLLLNARWFGWVHTLIKDLHLIGHSRYLYYAALVSLPYLLMQVIPIWAMIRAYHHLSTVTFGAAMALMVISRLGAVLPGAPGNIGTSNGITIIGLRLFNVPIATARRFSLILWAAITLPLLLAGFVAVVLTGVRMGELHKHARGHVTRKPEINDTDDEDALPVS